MVGHLDSVKVLHLGCEIYWNMNLEMPCGTDRENLETRRLVRCHTAFVSSVSAYIVEKVLKIGNGNND